MIKKSLTLLCIWLWCQLGQAVEPTPLHYSRIDKAGHQIHLLEVDLNHYKIISVRAKDNEQQKSEVSALVKQYGATAGINGGFFHLNENGVASPAGALKIDNQWLGYSQIPRGAIGWSSESGVLVDRIIIKKNTQKNNIEVKPLLDNSSASKKAWQAFDYIVGGIPLLIKNGKVITDHTSEKSSKAFLEERHARTAICIKDPTHWIFVASSHTKAPYRQYTHEIVEGLTIKELSDFLLSLGCFDAINLDGGGSTTLVYQNKIMNSPAGDMDDIVHLFHERQVHDAILVLPRSL